MDDTAMLALVQEFAELGADLHGEGADNDEVLSRMLDLATKHVPGCCWASVTIFGEGGGRTLAASDDTARVADQLQYDLDEGPCVSAAHRNATYAMVDLTSDRQWPRYAAAVAEQTPIRSVLALQLEAKESAALNLYGDEHTAVDSQTLLVGSIFAAQTSSMIALYEAEQESAQLGRALVSSREISAAVGILMNHHKITQDAAFEMLRTASQHLNRNLRELAARVVETGELPDRPH